MDDMAIRDWLARAVPAQVRFVAAMPEGLEDALGAYPDGSDPDEIFVLRPDDTKFGADRASFLSVLVHEAVHATKHKDRLNRNNWARSTIDDLLTYLDGTRRALEETTAYVATVALAKDLGFEPGLLAREIARLNLEAAPDHYKPTIERDAAAAVAWLKERAATVEARPFNDDLARWAREG